MDDASLVDLDGMDAATLAAIEAELLSALTPDQRQRAEAGFKRIDERMTKASDTIIMRVFGISARQPDQARVAYTVGQLRAAMKSAFGAGGDAYAVEYATSISQHQPRPT